ncbi:hypothetical protein V2J91_23590 [Pseudomonas alliivorans]|nr:hypothetical protein [Pseudomonas alliivorans]
MSNDKMREEFETWVLREYPNQHMGRFATGEYHSTVIEHCWQAWQASREVEALEPVVGDQLPPVGSKVQIHLGSLDAWVDHTVAGYYVWGDLGGNDSLSRVFVRVRDESGYLNARLLKDVRTIVASALGETVSVPKELLS